MTPKTPEWVSDVLSGLPRMLTVGEVADLLRCSNRTVTRLIASGRLTARKTDKQVLVPRSEFEKYLSQLGAA